MQQVLNGQAIALQRITDEARDHTGFLDLSELGLTELPEGLFELTHLRRLHLGYRLTQVNGQWSRVSEQVELSNRFDDLERISILRNLNILSLGHLGCHNLAFVEKLQDLVELDCNGTQITDLAPLVELKALRSLDCGFTPVADLASLAGLDSLQWFYCTHSQVSDLTPLANLRGLQWLSCSSRRVSDLTPLSKLTALLWLDCGITQVSNLEPLARLCALQNLFCAGTQITDLAPLAGLESLQRLVCGHTKISDLAPLAKLKALVSLDCSNTAVSKLSPLSELLALRTIGCSSTQVEDLAPLENLVGLQEFHCASTHVSDLSALKGLKNLRSLYCGLTRVSDLAPLMKLTALESVNCDQTDVLDLTPLEKLTTLRRIHCRRTKVSDLTPLKNLNLLEWLDCAYTPVFDLTPIAKLGAMQFIDCSLTGVTNLTPLVDLHDLRTLNCNRTQVPDIGVLATLKMLQTLNCNSTRVTDLTPLASLDALQSLDCSHTQVSDLAPLANLVALHSLDCSGCHLVNVPNAIWYMPSLRGLTMWQTTVPGLPAEVISQKPGENCLEPIRAHLRDQAAGTELLTDVKLLVLGNGASGKTQLTRFLCNLPFQEGWYSTHGIRLVDAALPVGHGTPDIKLHIWDFGGQDIYHGTHALYVRTHALFAVVWARKTEPPPLEYDHQGLTFRQYPLQYWCNYVGHLRGHQGPLLIVQTQCDSDADEAPVFPLPVETRTSLGPAREVRFSAKSDYRGHDELIAALRGAVARLREQKGAATIGVGRLRLQRRIEQLRSADGSLPEAWRLMDQATFRAWCAEVGYISSPEQMLRYLHNAGIVFYRSGLFGDRIVLDQARALNAIYAVFDRTRCYKRLLLDHGRFDRARLEELVWQDLTSEEQRLFLTMMQSCGICFIYRRGRPPADDDETIYIAPDLLPLRAVVQTQIEARWGTDPATQSVTFDYLLLHPGLMRAVIARIGDQAGIDAIYWRGGVTVYETTLRSHALIEHTIAEGACHGTVILQTKGSQATELLNRFAAWISEENDRLGLCATTNHSTPLFRLDPHPALVFGQQPSTKPEYCVSYAWADDTTNGTTRENIVNELCAAAERRGITILRDKTDMRLGDQISIFMRRLSQSSRVFVILSERYLRSVYCMTELYQVWLNCRGEEKPFLDRIRVYAQPDTKIGDIFERTAHIAWWKQRHDQVRDLVRQHGEDFLSERDYAEFRRMGHFVRVVPEILSSLQDSLRPRSFAELEQYGFEAPP